MCACCNHVPLSSVCDCVHAAHILNQCIYMCACCNRVPVCVIVCMLQYLEPVHIYVCMLQSCTSVCDCVHAAHIYKHRYPFMTSSMKLKLLARIFYRYQNSILSRPYECEIRFLEVPIKFHAAVQSYGTSICPYGVDHYVISPVNSFFLSIDCSLPFYLFHDHFVESLCIQMMEDRSEAFQLMAWHRPDIILSSLSLNILTGECARLGEEW